MVGHFSLSMLGIYNSSSPIVLYNFFDNVVYQFVYFIILYLFNDDRCGVDVGALLDMVVHDMHLRTAASARDHVTLQQTNRQTNTQTIQVQYIVKVPQHGIEAEEATPHKRPKGYTRELSEHAQTTLEQVHHSCLPRTTYR